MQNSCDRTGVAPDRNLIAVVGICLVLLASVAPHFGFVPAGTQALIKARNSHATQQSLANDALPWNVPRAQLALALPRPSLALTGNGKDSNYAPRDVAAQLYNRPPPSA